MESLKLDRRALIHRVGSFAAATLLTPIIASCAPRGVNQDSTQTGKGGLGGNAPGQLAGAWTEMMTLALRVEYFSAQFYAIGTTGSPATRQPDGRVFGGNMVKGGHRVPFADPLLEQHALDLAADKIAHVVGLRDQLGSAEPAWPDIDFGVTRDSPFSQVAQQAGIVRKAVVFDPFADDASFLLAAFLLEDGMAAAYRGMIDSGPAPTPKVVTSNLADAIFEGGLVRSLIATAAEPGSQLALSMTTLSKFLAHLDGSDLSGTSPASGSDQVMSVEDASGTAIPITRMPSQFSAGPGLLITTHQ